MPVFVDYVGFEPMLINFFQYRIVLPFSRLKLLFLLTHCGPEGNRTLHSLLAREKRQPWNIRAQNTHLTFNSTFTTNYRMSPRVLVNHYLRKIIWYISGGDYEIRTPPKSCKDFGYHYIIIPINLKNFWRAFPHC